MLLCRRDGGLLLRMPLGEEDSHDDDSDDDSKSPELGWGQLLALLDGMYEHRGWRTG